MYPRTNYEMTPAQCDALLATMKPVPYMVIGGVAPRSQQENANAAWAALGAQMGFDYNTVQPIEGKGMLHFSAVPSENETQRAERLEKEAAEKKRAEVRRLEIVIAEAQEELRKLA
jgi:hypothetical protein